jgi:hypothetical protein
MRTIVLFAALALGACTDSKKARTTCEDAVANANRLDATAGLTVASCRDADLTREELACLAYASDPAELRACGTDRIFAGGR